MKSVAVLGGGTMGLGIASLFSRHYYDVSLYEPSTERQRVIQDQLRNTSASLTLSMEIEKAITDTDLIIECVPEDIAIKRKVYEQISPFVKSDGIVASNTSTYSLEQLAEGLPYADRMVITHFFNPADIIPLVELISLPQTKSGIVDQLVDVFQNMGKTPVVLNQDIPGFIANRLQAALMREACYLLDEGIASAEQIDSVVSNGLGPRWALKGPFAIADLGGLDIWSKVTGHLFPQLDNRTKTPEFMLEKVARGELGVKTGSGYYEYENGEKHPAQHMQAQLQHLLGQKNTLQEGKGHHGSK